MLAVQKHSNRNIDSTLGCVLFSLRAHPTAARGSQQPECQAGSGRVFSIPRRGYLGAFRIYCSCRMTHCCDRQHMMSLSCFICSDTDAGQNAFPTWQNCHGTICMQCQSGISLFLLLRCIDFGVFSHSRHISLPISF